MTTALIIGASGGIGSACMDWLRTAGYTVYGTYLTNPREGLHLLSVTDQHNMQQILHMLKPLHVIVNCAGFLEQKPYTEISGSDWNMVMNINLYGTFNVLRCAMPIMLEQKTGCIVNMASIGGQTGGTLAVHYAAAKAGVISLTKSFARIGAPYVRVNCVSPGLIATEMTKAEIASASGKDKINSIPLGRVGTAEEVAKAVMYLVDNGYVTGQVINVNGGAYI